MHESPVGPAVKEKTRHPRWFFFSRHIKKNRRLAASHFTDTNTNEPHVAAFSSFASPFLLLLFLSPRPPAGQEPKVLNDPRVPAFYSFAPPLSHITLLQLFYIRRPHLLTPLTLAHPVSRLLLQTNKPV